MSAAEAAVDACRLTAFGPEMLSSLLGVQPADLAPEAAATLLDHELAYEVLEGAEREAAFVLAVSALVEDELAEAGPQRHERWEQGWAENRDEFRASGYTFDRLRPKYIHHRTMRLLGDYVEVSETAFEDIVFTALREHLFDRWLQEPTSVVEFGCGTGTSLHLLGKGSPDKRLVGCDWARPSQDILADIATETGLSIEGHWFDMFEPTADVPFPEHAGVMTFTAMEQLGGDFVAFAEYLCARRPSICVHVEPTSELYDPADLFDYVALQYHLRRNYLRGFLPWLRAQESAGSIEVLEARRLGFGSFHHEGYTVLVWRPLRA